MMKLQLTMVSHACVIIEADNSKLLCDPWFLNEPVYNFSTWKYPRAVMPSEEIVSGLTHLFISHSHEDHFHVPSIDRLPRSIKVMLPEYDWYDGERAKTVERVMRALGFENIVKLLPFNTVHLDKNFHITPIPAAESKPHDWENCGLAIEHDGVRILNMNDCPSDDALYARVAERFSHFDLVLLQYAGVTMHPGLFHMSEDEMRAIVAQKRASFAEQERAMDRLSIGTLVPFAGDFAWYGEEMLHCNWACRAAPTMFENWFREAYPQSETRLELMYPSDTWTPREGAKRNHPEVEWSSYLEDINRISQLLQPKIGAIRGWLEDSDRRDLVKRTHTFLKIIENGCREIDVDFDTSMRIAIQYGPDSFSFVWRFSKVDGFHVSWEDQSACDQTIYLPVHVWASILEGKMMLGMVSWISKIDQHVPFRLDIAKMWFWTEFHLDLNNRNPQALINTVAFPEFTVPVQPSAGTFDAYDSFPTRVRAVEVS